MLFTPKRVAAVTTACDTEDPQLRVQMTEGDLYNANDRMDFIDLVAAQYHKLMDEQSIYMEATLQEIAKWHQEA